MKTNRKFRFGFTKSDRNGIFMFCLILISGIGFNYWYSTSTSKSFTKSFHDESINSIQQLIDSLKNKQSLDNQREIYPFNPNFITDYKGYTLEMNTDQIDRLLEFRAKDQWINSKDQFQKVTQVSDQWMDTYSKYFKFPDWVEDQEKNKFVDFKKNITSASPKKDLNTVTAEDLQLVSGIGEVLSNRIITYRQKIGGFVNSIQLKDVYGLSPEVIQELKVQIELKTPVEVKKQNINTIGVLQLSELPYFDYELSRSVVDFIKLRQGISNFKELSIIDGFPVSKLDRIQLYLEINK